MNEEDIRRHTDLIAQATQYARVRMGFAEDDMGEALDALARAQEDIPNMVNQARLVREGDAPDVYMTRAQSYGHDIDLKMELARNKTEEAGDRLGEGIKAITAAKRSLAELETAAAAPEQTGAEQTGAEQTGAAQAGAVQTGAVQTGAVQTGVAQTGVAPAWPEDVPTLSDLRQRIELFEESLTAATECAEDVAHQIEQSREGLTNLENVSYQVRDPEESAQLIEDAGHAPWRATHHMSDQIRAGEATYRLGAEEAVSAARGADELDRAVRAGLNPTAKSAQVKPAASSDQGAQDRLHLRLGGQERPSALRDY
ncbi:hypothetical protein ACWGID_01670 [Kribbella sp. NPDC054772]